MESILQYMYLGEGRFYYERMGEAIKVAKDLEVKEISKGLEVPNEKEVITEETVTIPDEGKEPDDEDVEPRQTSENKIRQRQLQIQISSDAKSTECPECGKVFSYKHAMLKHYRSIHKGIKYPCNQCDYQATSQSHLKRHIQSKHECIKYSCNQCDYQALYQGNLQTHILSKHEGRKYLC